ncbi:hypothetical protein [Amycolatopsis magusensis]|uniref:hypothetical protein n=1 Tax=Amycolatopsis magusensis TaxID=882444 RepID=UPI00379A04AB
MPPGSIFTTRERAAHRHQVALLADRAWLALAALAEAGPDNVVAEQLLAAAPTVQHLSLRNQVTLLVQAGEQRLLLRDVDTEAGWARRGRIPRQRGLRVVRPHDGSGRAGGRRAFRVSYRWEFAQTDPVVNGAPPQTTPDAAGDPAEFAENLIDQLGERGYRVTPGAATAVDHEAQRITIADSTWHADPAAAVRLLIPALAHALVTGAAPALSVAGDRRAG